MNSKGKSVSARQKIQRTLQLGRALRFVWHSARGWTLASGALLVIQGLLPLLPLYLMKLTVDAVSAGLDVAGNAAAFEPVLLLIGLMAAVALVSAVISSIAALVGEGQSLAVTEYMNNVLQAKSIEIDLEYYESARYYDTLRRAQQEAPFRPTRIVNGLVKIGHNAISLLAIAGLLFLFHWIVAVILFFAVIPGIAVRLRNADKMFRWKREQTATERQADYLNWILTGLTHAKEIRLFDLGPLIAGRFRQLRRNLREARLGIATRRSLAELMGQTSATVAIYGSYAFIAYRAVHGAITLGDMVMYFLAFQRGQGFLQEMLSALAGLYEDNLFLANLFEFLDLKRKVVEPVRGSAIPQTMKTGIVFDHVGFQYPTGTRRVLEDISLVIRPGEVVALVGGNGSGKTTLIKLLCRLYDPSEGNITLDGVDLRHFETKALRSQISVIFQDYAQYHLSARENIWFGNTALAPEDERVAAAARRSGAEDIISALPHGYETILGKQFEDGEELSIGEWQKVALARAFLRDTQIIVLDEPTSSMDANAEQSVFNNFRQLAQERTAILISHRFSTVRMADRIYVLEEGRIREGGTHDELIHLGQTYAHMFETQARHYR